MHTIGRVVGVSLVLSALLLAGCSGGSKTASTQVIVSGSTTILPIAEQTAEAFQKANPGTRVLVSGLGSSAGIEAVSAGTADIGTSSRDLKPEEGNLGLIDTPVAYDGIAVIVSPSNPLSNLTKTQLADIFSGRIKNWDEVGGSNRPIDLVNRDESSGTRDAFTKLVMGTSTFDPRAAVLPGTGQVRDVVARAAGAIGYISIGFVKPRFTDVAVKALSVDGVAPTEANIASGKYPVGRRLHFFTKGEPTGLTKKYVDYMLSDAVQKGVVVDAGFIPVAEGGKR